MSKIALSGNASGTGTLTIEAPNTNTDRTLTLPDASGTIQVSGNPISGTTGSFSGTITGSQFDSASNISNYTVPGTVASNQPRVLLLATTGGSGRLISGVFRAGRSISSGATRAHEINVQLGIDQTGGINNCNVNFFGLMPSSVNRLVTCSYGGSSWVGIEMGTTTSSAYPTAYLFEGLVAENQMQVVPTANVTSLAAYNNSSGEGYLCRAWVNFNGTGTVAIRAGGNVSSITDRGTGVYQVNLTTAMPDVNYSVCIGGKAISSPTFGVCASLLWDEDPTVNNFSITTQADNGARYDLPIVSVQVFR
jgi:hypothetical protein